MHNSNSVLTSRLTKQVIKTFLILMTLLAIVLLVFLIPSLYRVSTHRTTEYTRFIANQYNETLSRISSEMSNVTLDNDLLNVLKAYNKNSSPQNASKIRLQLQSVAAAHTSVVCCFIETEDKRLISSFSTLSKGLGDLYLSDSYMQSLKQRSSYTYFSQIYPYVDLAGEERYGIFYTCSLLCKGKKYAFISFYDMNHCINTCSTISEETLSGYQILTAFQKSDHSGRIFHAGAAFPTDSENLRLDYSDIAHTRYGIYQQASIPLSGWSCISYTSWLQLFSALFPILLLIAAFFVLIPFLFTRVIPPVNNRFLHPLSTLTNALSSYNAGDILSFDIHTNDEIELLSSTVSQMSRKISMQIEDIRYKERRNSLTQYSLLATQIDPHFIYNTLNVINIMAAQNHQENIVKINTALSKILRERFSVKSTIFDTIENELDTISQYYTIMKYRYQNEVRLDIGAENSILQEKIPKNLLIPIVENSYYHGLSTEGGIFKGNIDITIYDIGNKISIEISDNGNGISPEKLDFLKKNNFKTPDSDRTHIGLSNVYDRLLYIYQDQFQFEISSNVGFGTTISITVPMYQPSFEENFFKE